MKRQKTKTRKKINYLRVAIIVIILGLIVWGIFALMCELSNRSNNSANNTDNTTVQPEEDPIKSQDPDNPNGIADDKDISGGSDKPQTPATNPDTGLKNATVAISYAGSANGQVSASGWVTNIVETTGTCTYVFTNKSTGKTITETTSPHSNPSSTVCESISLNQSQFSTGEWSVILKYQSNTSKGESESAIFQVK